MPASVRVGFEKVKVKEDIPKPRQCHTCWKLGHAKKHCEGIPCCPICGTLTHTLQHCPHHGDRSYRGHCPNCNEDGHTAFSKLCALYRREEDLTMYRQGITKEKVRKLLTDTGRYADIVYARRFAQGANSLVPSHQHHHHHHQQQQKQQLEQQQPPLEVVSREQDKSTQERAEHEVVVENKPGEISPEDRMGILFGEDPIEFLSVEVESTEQVSSEDLPSRVHFSSLFQQPYSITRGLELILNEGNDTDSWFRSSGEKERECGSQNRTNYYPLFCPNIMTTHANCHKITLLTPTEEEIHPHERLSATSYFRPTPGLWNRSEQPNLYYAF